MPRIEIGGAFEELARLARLTALHHACAELIEDDGMTGRQLRCAH
jgi:hypothetical protein